MNKPTKDIIEHFYQQYERIEESTPRDEGEWVFIWGEPDSLVSLIDYDQPNADAAMTGIEEREGISRDEEEWVPVPHDDK